ncbi:MAG: hypothetical protein IPI38_01210 [Gemmatimonadetes bacterium]|nr:hypothetical protein [Gemmatimonadota bacterium]MBP6669826.1 hypothetical protein [Gemmatimonadales bacterium]MBK6779212.1 hypothetical protein [Gemmatimonadota bacterium]MBK7348475.1 hypothetical protein [Gemmatimonadota bacterium]MBK7714043.1 hypothetical protein [Gemmatimonadota bacterium]
MRLILRLLAPAGTAAEAAARLGEELLPAGFRMAAPPEPYWKMPAWYEHTWHLDPATEADFDQLLARTPLGWHHVVRDGECDAVWVAEPGAAFLIPEATWAQVLLVHPPAP